VLPPPFASSSSVQATPKSIQPLGPETPAALLPVMLLRSILYPLGLAVSGCLGVGAYRTGPGAAANCRLSGPGEVEQFVHRPLVVYVPAVLGRQDPAIGADEEVRRQA